MPARKLKGRSDFRNEAKENSKKKSLCGGEKEMIFFQDWNIRFDGGPIARQFDNLTRTLTVSGEIPAGWEWVMLVQVGDAMDILPLTASENGLSIVLTAAQLSVSGFYNMQLRGTQGDKVRHTNVIHVYIPTSLSGDTHWPEIPSEFSEAEKRVLDSTKKAEMAAEKTESYIVNPPVVGENENWWLWNGASYEDSGKPSRGRAGTENAVFYTKQTLSEEEKAQARKNIGAMETVTPQMYGAVADGVTDDTEAIQAAVNASDNVFIPDGIYLISKSIIIENAKAFYTTDGYLGKKVSGAAGTKFIVTKNVPAVIVRGYHNLVENLVLTFSDAIYSEYSSALLRVESLAKNAIKQSCNNVFNNIRCVTIRNAATVSGKYSGIGIELVSDGTGATYQNKFNDCNVVDLYKGLVIENNSGAGINENYFHVDLWNCNYLLVCNGGGNTFDVRAQAGARLSSEENVCLVVEGSQNTFTGYVYDSGRFDRTETMAPLLHVTGINNVFNIPVPPDNIGGAVRSNYFKFFATRGYNYNVPAHGNRITVCGAGGTPVSVAPYVNSLQNSLVSDIVLETENATLWGCEAVYTEKDENGIPTNIAPLVSNAINKQITFNVVDGSIIRIKFTMPNYSKVDNLSLYINNRRTLPTSARLRIYKDSFGSDQYIEEPYDFTNTHPNQLTCYQFAPTFYDLNTYRYAELELRFNTAGMFGMSYLSAVIINDLYGPLLNDK